MIDRMTVAAVARELGLSWDTVNTIAMDATQTIVAADTTRLDGVRVIGVDEHRWSHTRRHGEDGFVTVIIDLTPVLEGTGRARLLDLVPGRSAAALRTWLASQSSTFRDQVQVGPWTGSAADRSSDQLPGATAVMDLSHVVGLSRHQARPKGQRVNSRPAVTVALRIRSIACVGPCALATAVEHPPATPTDRGVRRRRPPLGRADLCVYQRIIAAYSQPGTPRQP